MIAGMQQQLIDGTWTDGRGESVRSITNPATREVLDTVPDAGPADVRRAVAAAVVAQRQWSRLPIQVRTTRLMELGIRVRADADQLAMLMTRESGAPLPEARDCVTDVAACFEAAAAFGSTELPTLNDAAGIVAAIPSYRWPLLQMARVAVPALLEGHAWIGKPPATTPLTCLRFGRFHDSLPPGVLSMLTGGEGVAAALRQQPEVLPASARQLEGDLEYRPIIVLPDAELDLAVPGVSWARLRQSGQAGDAAGPVLVCRSIAAEFADRLHEFLAFLEVGDPTKRETDLGPLISREAALQVEQRVAQAAKAGARLVLGGRCYQPWGLSGHFFQPTLLTGVHPDHVVYRERIAGPVLSITPVADADEAIGLAAELRPSSVVVYGRMGGHRKPDVALSCITAPDSRWFPYAKR